MLLEALLGLVDGVMELLLALQMIIRIALLDALLVLAPAGLLCYAWPRLQGMAALWGRLFVVTLITQFVQIVVLHMGEDLVQRGRPPRPWPPTPSSRVPDTCGSMRGGAEQAA